MKKGMKHPLAAATGTFQTGGHQQRALWCQYLSSGVEREIKRERDGHGDKTAGPQQYPDVFSGPPPSVSTLHRIRVSA